MHCWFFWQAGHRNWWPAWTPHTCGSSMIAQYYPRWYISPWRSALRKGQKQWHPESRVFTKHASTHTFSYSQSKKKWHLLRQKEEEWPIESVNQKILPCRYGFGNKGCTISNNLHGVGGIASEMRKKAVQKGCWQIQTEILPDYHCHAKLIVARKKLVRPVCSLAPEYL